MWLCTTLPVTDLNYNDLIQIHSLILRKVQVNILNFYILSPLISRKWMVLKNNLHLECSLLTIFHYRNYFYRIELIFYLVTGDITLSDVCVCLVWIVTFTLNIKYKRHSKCLMFYVTKTFHLTCFKTTLYPYIVSLNHPF